MFSGNMGLSGDAIHPAIFFNFVSLDMSAASFAANYLSGSHADHPFLAAVGVLVAGCGELLTGAFFATFCNASAGYVI
jgi:hypothetical protein